MLSSAGLAGSARAADAKDQCRHKSETRVCCLSTCIVSLAQLCFLRGDQNPGVSPLVYFLSFGLRHWTGVADAPPVPASVFLPVLSPGDSFRSYARAT